MKAKIMLLSNSNKREFTKEFKDLSAFHRYKQGVLDTNCRYIKYSLLLDGSTKFTKPKVEYGNLNKRKQQSRRNNTLDNKIQKSSRNNQLALVGNDLINLNMTPSKQRSLVKWMDNKPVTNSEKNLIKSMFSYDKISVAQYNVIEDIKAKVNRRIKL